MVTGLDFEKVCDTCSYSVLEGLENDTIFLKDNIFIGEYEILAVLSLYFKKLIVLLPYL